VAPIRWLGSMARAPGRARGAESASNSNSAAAGQKLRGVAAVAAVAAVAGLAGVGLSGEALSGDVRARVSARAGGRARTAGAVTAGGRSAGSVLPFAAPHPFAERGKEEDDRAGPGCQRARDAGRGRGLPLSGCFMGRPSWAAEWEKGKRGRRRGPAGLARLGCG
jgi:hypothetical protein